MCVLVYTLINCSDYCIRYMAEDITETSLNHSILVLDTIRKMRDSEAGGDYVKYADYFFFALQLLIPYIPTETRKRIEEDYLLLIEAIKEAKEGKSHKTSKTTDIKELRRNFADTHRAYLMSGLSRTGIIKVLDEGTIDFTQMDIDTIAGIIRNSGTGLNKAIEKGLGAKDGKT